MPGESSGCLREPQITLGFGFEPSLKFGVGVLGRVEQLLDARQRTTGCFGAGLNGLVGAVEIVPCEKLDVGAENQVRMALPNFELMLLSGTDGAADHLKDVGWSPAMPIFDTNGNGDDMLGT